MDEHLTLSAEEEKALKDEKEPWTKIPVEQKYPASKPQKRTLNIFYILFAILFLLCIFAIGSYFLWMEISPNLKKNIQDFNLSSQAQTQLITITQTQNPTEWQTYNGPENFTTKTSPYLLKYPPSWQFAPSLSHNGKTYLEDVIANDTSDLSQRYILTIDTIKNDASTLKEFIAKHQGPGASPDLTLDNFVKDASIKIANIDWMIDRHVSGSDKNEAAIFLKGDTVILLTCTHCGDVITNQILSTFKFSN